MPIQSRKNQYFGVNAHLQSYFQRYGGWESFHNNHIGDLAKALDRGLPAGYTVDIKQSLQIRESHPDTGEKIIRPKPDTEIYVERPYPPSAIAPSAFATATLTMPVSETLDLDPDLYLVSVKIYKADDRSGLGTPVTLIEVLSRTNKRGGDGYTHYHDKRFAVLQSGLRLVEIDYLHESGSPIKGIPPYPAAPNSHPYTVTVSDPYPSLQTGISAMYGFAVDQPIPAITIPLAGDETMTLDLNTVYQQTFHSLRAYSQRVDYAELPERFASYSQNDQDTIKRRMALIQQKLAEGVDLETGPFAASDPVSLN